jgi:fatty-acyl-CoA synthase
VGGSNVSRAAAFDVGEDDGRTRILLLAECWSRDAEVREALVRDIAAAARSAAGAPVEVHLVPVRTLPMTSSGKLSRAGARARFLAGGFAQDDAPAPAARPAAVPGLGG